MIAPPSGVNFTAFTSTLLSTCWRRFGSPSIGGRSPAMRHSTVIRLASAATDTPATTASSSAGIATGAKIDHQLAADDPRDVEDVLDQLRLQPRVPADHFDRLLRACGGEGAALQHRHPAQDRVQRRPQLVRERGQELVLEPAGFLGRGEPGELGLLAPGHHHAHAAHRHRLAVAIFDPSLAFAPAHGAVGRDDAVLDVVRDAFGDGALQRGAHPRAILRMDLALVAGEGAVEGARRQSVNARRGCRTTARCWCRDPSPTCPSTPRRARSGAAPRCAARCSSARVRSTAKATCAAMTPASSSSSSVGAARRRVVQHELADDPVEADQRDEGHRGDALGLRRLADRTPATRPARTSATTIGCGSGLSGRPRRVAFDRAAGRPRTARETP